jgi:hypothetical protein
MKPSILSRIGAICVSLGMLTNIFKIFELDKYNTLLTGGLLGAGLAFAISHFIKIKENNY